MGTFLRGNTICIQPGGNSLRAFTRQRLGKDTLDHLGLLRIDHHFLTVPFVAIGWRGKLEGSILEPTHHGPFAVFRDGRRFALSHTAENCQEQLALHCSGIDIFLFKIDGNAQILQRSNQFQAVCGIPGKAADGFRDNKIDVPGCAIRHQAHQLWPFFLLCSSDAFVIVKTRELPIIP